jgi:hypothetical protein
MDGFTPTTLATSNLSGFLDRSMSASIFEPGGLAGNAGFGFSPGQSEAAWLKDRALRQQTYAMDVYRESARGQAFANMLGAQAQDNFYRRSSLQMYGTVMNMPGVASMFGGSDIDFLFGSQNAVQASGLRVGGSRLFGGGALSDRVAYDLWKASDRYFFDEKAGGMGRLDRTQGFDRTQLGQIYSVMGQRGAFSGLDIGASVSTVGGKLDIRYDEAAMQKMPKAVEEAAKALRMVQDVVGGRPTLELIKISENIIGASMGTAQYAATVQRRMAEVMASSSAFGYSPHATMQLQGSVLEGLTQMGIGGVGGAGLAAGITRTALMQHNVGRGFAAGANVYMTPHTIGQVAAGLSVSSAALAQDHKMQAFVLGQFMLDKGMLNNPELETMLRMQAPNETQLEKIAQHMNVLAGGSIPSALHRFGGYNNVYSKLSGDASERVGAASIGLLSDRALTIRLSRSFGTLRRTVNQITGNPALSDAAIDEQVWLASTLEPENQGKVAGIIASTDTAAEKTKKLRDIYNKDAGTEDLSALEIDKRIRTQLSQSSFFKQMFGLRAGLQDTDPKFALTLSKGAQRKMNRTIEMAADIYENQTPVGDFLGDMGRGIFGVAALDEEKLMQYGMMTGTGITKFNPDLIFTGSTKEKEAQREALRAILRDANPGITEAQLASATDAAWNDFTTAGQAGAGRVSENVVRKYRSRTGNSARRRDGTYYLQNAADKERLQASWGKGAENTAFYQLRKRIGALSDTDEATLKAQIGAGGGDMLTGAINDSLYTDTVTQAALSDDPATQAGLATLDKTRVGNALMAGIASRREKLKNATGAEKDKLQSEVEKLQDRAAAGAGGPAQLILGLMRDILRAINRTKEPGND